MPRKQKIKYKGLGKGVGGLCLLQHYCPFCFKGKIGVACGLHVGKGSSLIDEVQAFHAAQGNGLCPLDFRFPGDFCSNTVLCKMVCLVCGKATIDGEDDDFQLFYDLFGGVDDDKGCAVTTRYEVEDAMTHHKLVWSEQWDTPIHKKCSKKAACKCVVPIGATICRKHRCPVERVRQPQVPTLTPKKAEAAEVVTEKKLEITRAKPLIMLKKADWLPPPTTTTRATGFIASSSDGRKGLEKKKVAPSYPGVFKNVGEGGIGKGGYVPTPTTKELQQAASKKKKTAIGTSSHPVVAKPDTKTMRLKEAAKKCALKIDQWADVVPTERVECKKTDGGEDGKAQVKDTNDEMVYAFPISDWMKQHPINTKLDKEIQKSVVTEGGGEDAASGKKPSVLKIHNERFDPYLHGYWEVGGISVYRRGDGGEQRVTCGVNTIHDDGTLTPLV